MAIQGLVFFVVLFVVESDIINSIKMKLSPQVLLVDDDTSIHPSNSNLREDDNDVSEEKSNVLKLDQSELASDDNVLVLKCLTKRYSGNFLAVNKLCLKVRRILMTRREVVVNTVKPSDSNEMTLDDVDNYNYK